MQFKKKTGKKPCKKQCYRATKISQLPKARWAEMGSPFLKSGLPNIQFPPLFYMFEGHKSSTLWEGKEFWGFKRGPWRDPWKWTILHKLAIFGGLPRGPFYTPEPLYPLKVCYFYVPQTYKTMAEIECLEVGYPEICCPFRPSPSWAGGEIL